MRKVIVSEFVTLDGIPEGQISDLAQQGWNESFDKLAESLR